VIEGYIRPVRGFVAGGAVLAELPVVFVLRCMTGETILRRTLEYIIHMAGGTGDCGMCAAQWEGGLAMIEGHLLPPGGLVAGGTVLAELTVMDIVGRVTGETILGRTFEDIIDVARLAANSRVSAAQREGSLAVIEDDILPLGGLVARSTILAELPIMNIFGGVTGEAIFRGSFEYIVDMAGFAVDHEM